ncbi:MAG: two-component system OmpR family response regulator [Sulfitobacter sp.]|jgi:two-component system OmpR family response regulator
MKILEIEDDKTTGAYISDGLREEGHSVDLIPSGSDGLIQASIGQYDVIIVDPMLPGIDGVSLVKTLRGTKNRTPVLFLTSLSGVDDRIEGLNAGGDDYLVKPFAFGEPSARIAALGRRPQMQDEPSLRIAHGLRTARGYNLNSARRTNGRDDGQKRTW